MTREELEKTEWAKDVRKYCLEKYHDRVMKTALKENLKVRIVYECEYYTIETHGLYMRSFRTKEAALALCREMGWKVKR